MTTRRVSVSALVLVISAAALIGFAAPAQAAGNDFSLDFVAAGPGTYDHDSGEGGAYDDRTISKDDGVVESLEGGDFRCGDKVVYFLRIAVAETASGDQDLELDFSFLAEPTGSPGAGITDLVSAGGNPGDEGNVGDVDDTTVSISSEELDTTPPPPNDTLYATVRVSNLDPGETFILRLVTKLTCVPGSDPTGNLQAQLDSAEQVSPSEEAVPGGAQTIPFKQVGDIPTPATVEVSLGACVSGAGESHTPVTVEISPAGAADVEITGPDGYSKTITGSGGTVDLEPGDYSWEADANSGYELIGETSDDFTVSDCSRIPTTVTVELGACVPAIGGSHTPLTVTISPAGGAKVFLDTEDGFAYTFSGSGGTIDLEPGDYHWDADKTHGHVIVGKKAGTFEVEDCALEGVTVSATLGACTFALGKSSTPVTVTVDPADGATVEIRDAQGNVVEPGSQPDAGETGGETDEGEEDEAGVEVAAGAITEASPFASLAPGTYTWTATPAEGFGIVGPSSGTLNVVGCAVLAAKLPKTGSDLPGVVAMGLALLVAGFAMVSASGSRTALLAGWGSLSERLSGRNGWAGLSLPTYAIWFPDRPVGRVVTRPGWTRRYPGPWRFGPGY